MRRKRHYSLEKVLQCFFLFAPYVPIWDLLHLFSAHNYDSSSNTFAVKLQSDLHYDRSIHYGLMSRVYIDTSTCICSYMSSVFVSATRFCLRYLHIEQLF